MKKIIAGLLIVVVALAALPASAFTGKNAQEAAVQSTNKKTKAPIQHYRGRITEPPDPWDKTGKEAVPGVSGVVHHSKKTEPIDPYGKTGKEAVPVIRGTVHHSEKTEPIDPYGKTGAK